MVPARETGGDLYDYFLLDARRLFFLVGDVAGKGLSASIFMAVSKALYKSATLRAQDPDIGSLMTAANAEVSRDNPQMLFVTVFAGILDLESGELEYCNAGHENPFLVDPSTSAVRRIDDGDEEFAPDRSFGLVQVDFDPRRACDFSGHQTSGATADHGQAWSYCSRRCHRFSAA